MTLELIAEIERAEAALKKVRPKHLTRVVIINSPIADEIRELVRKAQLRNNMQKKPRN